MKYVSMIVAVALLAVCASNADACCHRPHLLARTAHVVRSVACSCATKCACATKCGSTESKVVVKRERTVVRGTCNGNTCTK